MRYYWSEMSSVRHIAILQDDHRFAIASVGLLDGKWWIFDALGQRNQPFRTALGAKRHLRNLVGK